jgi:hypothetical protein
MLEFIELLIHFAATVFKLLKPVAVKVVMDVLSKLAALAPRHNLVPYHDVFARGCHQPNVRLRKLIAPKSRKDPLRTRRINEQPCHSALYFNEISNCST